MSFYGGLVTVASNMINTYGQPLTLRTIALTGDEWNPTQITTDTETVGVLGNYSDRDRSAGLEDSSLIQKDDKYALLTIEPSEEDKLVIDSVVYSIVGVTTVNPGGTKLLYKAQIRA